MRPDMGKVVVKGRSRRKDVPKGRRRQRDPESLPDREKMREGYGWRDLPHDREAPLWRFLRSRVGSKWSDVYSEVSRNMDLKSFTGKHLDGHVRQVCDKRTSIWKRIPGWWHNGETLFVDQRGILRVAQYSFRQKRPRTDVSIIKIDDDLQYERIDGIWYLLEYGQKSSYDPLTGWTHRGRGIINKHQLNKRELRDIGKTNL